MENAQIDECHAFQSLDTLVQMEYLQKDGVYIGKIRKADRILVLYQYHTIYVEIIYTEYRKLVEQVNCYGETRILDQYLSADSFETEQL